VFTRQLGYSSRRDNFFIVIASINIKLAGVVLCSPQIALDIVGGALTQTDSLGLSRAPSPWGRNRLRDN